MIRFNASLLSIDYVQLKTVTGAVGGGMTYVDEDLSTDTHTELKREAIPFAVARAFSERHDKMTKYLHPVWAAVVRYDGHVVNLERHPAGSMGMLVDPQTGRHWTPVSEMVIAAITKTVANDGNDWYFDGRYLYKFRNKDLQTAIVSGTALDDVGLFHTVQVDAVDLSLSHEKQLNIEPRACVGLSFDSTFSVSAPIWKSVDSIGASKTVLVSDERSDDIHAESNAGNVLARFDTIDQKLGVNLEFALAAGKQLGKTFGYEAIEPLRLPALMIELETVNLPSLHTSVKKTHLIEMSFTHAMAWLLGLQTKVTTLNEALVMRAIIKHLTKRGIYRRNALKVDSIFQDTDVREVEHVGWERPGSKKQQLALAA